MDSELKKLEAKIDQLQATVEKVRKYFLWTLIVTLVLFILPLLGLVFALPSFLNNYVGSINSLNF